MIQMARLRLGVVLAVLASAGAAPASAHSLHERQTFDGLVSSADLIVRGAIVEASRREHGELWATLVIHKPLKGVWSGERVRFASDVDHGVHYAEGERVIVFLQRVTVANDPNKLFSPQRLAAKYRITSYRTDGYDALVTLLVEAAVQPASKRSAFLRQGLAPIRQSSEANAREFATQALQQLGE